MKICGVLYKHKTSYVLRIMVVGVFEGKFDDEGKDARAYRYKINC